MYPENDGYYREDESVICLMELFVPIEFENIEGVTDWKDCSYRIEVRTRFHIIHLES